jgi:branched-subunit amino acid transport protein
VEETRIWLILMMGLMAFGLRALPQMFFLGRNFPESWDRFVQYLSYALICSIIATTLFMTAGQFQLHAAPGRAAALIATIVVAHFTKSAPTAMIVGTLVVTVWSWLA